MSTSVVTGSKPSAWKARRWWPGGKVSIGVTGCIGPPSIETRSFAG
jgi:hypothetical protein